MPPCPILRITGSLGISSMPATGLAAQRRLGRQLRCQGGTICCGAQPTRVCVDVGLLTIAHLCARKVQKLLLALHRGKLAEVIKVHEDHLTAFERAVTRVLSHCPSAKSWHLVGEVERRRKPWPTPITGLCRNRFSQDAATYCSLLLVSLR